MKSLMNMLLGLNSDFNSVFFTNEMKALAGTGYKTIIALTTILLLTFLALGFAIGSIENLKLKMDNPFTNWVDLQVTNKNDMYDKLEKIQSRYEQQEVTEQFGIESMVSLGRRAVDFYSASYDIFSHPKDTLKRMAFGRTIEAGEAIYNRILDVNTGNVVWIDPSFANVEESEFSGCEIIISESFMKALDYEDPSTIGHILIDDEERFFLKVVAVLKELPGKNDFIISPILFNVQEAVANCRKQLLVTNKTGENIFQFLLKDKKTLPNLKKEANRFFGDKKPKIEIEGSFKYGEETNWECKIYFPPARVASLDSVQYFLSAFRKTYGVSDYAYIDCGGKICKDIGLRNIHYLAFHFNFLDNIRNFKDDLAENFNVDLDMNKVESKENFALVSRLTFVTAIMLLLFSVLSIVLFVNNLLQTHLSRVRPNLGTFQAFGLDNAFLVKTYLKLIFSILFISTLIAFFISIIADRVEQFILGDNSYFNIFSPYILFAIIVVILVSVFLSSRAINRILNDTPGNLIYGR